MGKIFSSINIFSLHGFRATDMNELNHTFNIKWGRISNNVVGHSMAQGTCSLFRIELTRPDAMGHVVAI